MASLTKGSIAELYAEYKAAKPQLDRIFLIEALTAKKQEAQASAV